MSKAHWTWSTETPDGQCPECGGETLRIAAGADWLFADSVDECIGDIVDIDDEVTGHWCPECRALRAVSINTPETPDQPSRASEAEDCGVTVTTVEHSEDNEQVIATTGDTLRTVFNSGSNRSAATQIAVLHNQIARLRADG